MSAKVLLLALFLNLPWIMQGTMSEIAFAAITTIIGAISLAIMAVGFLITRASLIERLLFGIAGAMLILPGLFTDIVGMGLLATGVIIHMARHLRLASR